MGVHGLIGGFEDIKTFDFYIIYLSRGFHYRELYSTYVEGY